MSTQVKTQDTGIPKSGFYLNWILANAAAETIGIGSAALIAVLLASGENTGGDFHPILLFIAVVLGGTLIEGVFVGLFQGLALKDVIPAGKWTLYTTIGAGIAWMLGMLPSTLIELFSSPEPVALAGEPGMDMSAMSPLLTMILAALMGLVLGPFLAVPQWMLLRRYLSGTTWYWIPANMIAWAAGMMFIFASMDFMPPELSVLMAGVWGAGVGAVTGLIVGVIHGAVIRRFV